MGTLKKNLLLITLVMIISLVPLFLNPDADYEGADGKAEEMIMVINPDYEPWMKSFWEPPSGEIESLLFALQAAIGAGFIAYFFGYHLGRKSNIKVTDR